MNTIPPYTPGTGNPEADSLLAEVAERFGGAAPNFHRVLANSPAALARFSGIYLAMKSSKLASLEKEIAALEVARRYQCPYCLAAHGKMARAEGLSSDDLTLLLDHRAISDPRLELIRRATSDIMDCGGSVHRMGEGTVLGDLEAAEIVEITAVIATFTFASLVNNLADTPIDPMFR